MSDGQRIVFFSLNYSPESTGIAPYSTHLAEALAERGHEVEVITGFPHYPEWKRRPGFSKTEVRRGVFVRRLEHPVPKKPGLTARLRIEMVFALRCLRVRLEEPDVILAVSPSLLSAAAAVIRGRLFNIPVVVWVQDLYGFGAAETGMVGGAVAEILIKIESAILRAASAVVGIHQRFADRLAEMAVPAERTYVIRNWSHVKPVAGDVRSAELRRVFGWSDNEFVVLHAGNMGAKQGLENVIEAGRLAEGTDVRFVLLGDGNQRRKLEELAAGVPNVTIADSVSEEQFLPTLQAADALLVNERPTVSDMAVPSKLTSYFAAGRPVVAAVNPDGVTAEEVQRSNGGLVLEAGDPSALLTGVLHLAQDPVRRRTLAEAGRRYREKLLCAIAAVTTFEALLSELAITAKPRALKGKES